MSVPTFNFDFDGDNLSFESCSTDSKSCCCPSDEEIIDIKSHWNEIYKSNKSENLEWYEGKASESLYLINKCELDSEALIMNIGAGTTTLINELINFNYKNIFATDISNVALEKLAKSIDIANKSKITLVEDDLTNASTLKDIRNIDLWHDRAVLHFFTTENDIKSYFELLNYSVKVGGYAILSQFSKLGTDQCSGFTVRQYDIEMLIKELGDNFELISHFDHQYTSPNGNKKDFIYTLFKKVK